MEYQGEIGRGASHKPVVIRHDLGPCSPQGTPTPLCRSPFLRPLGIARNHAHAGCCLQLPARAFVWLWLLVPYTAAIAGSVQLSSPVSTCPATWYLKLASSATSMVKSYQPCVPCRLKVFSISSPASTTLETTLLVWPFFV